MSSDDSGPPSKRSGRGATRLKALTKKLASGKKTKVDVDVNTGMAYGSNGKLFRTYLGIVAREKISILTPSWDHVTEHERNIIWEDILVRNCENFKILIIYMMMS